jgi:hypothetical protein
MLSFFPGYSGILRYGHRSFLAAALFFALLLDGFLIVNFYWTALITPNQRNVLLLALVGIWIILLTAESFWHRHLQSFLQTDEKDETYRQAVADYLRGDWFAAESQILPYLKKHPKDIEMLLLQATMYRHTQRYEESLAVLSKLQLYEGANRWFPEIEMERNLIAKEMQEPTKETTA